MHESIASAIVLLMLIYVVCGAVFTIVFQLWGIRRLDEDAPGSTWGFRMIIIPGCVVMWPFLLKRWLAISKK